MKVYVDRQYRNALDKLLDKVYEASDDAGWDWYELARQAGLHYSTIRRIGERETLLVRYYTVVKLTRCLGLKIDL